MQLHQLAYFVAVAETRHFTRAAEREHVAQPSLSQQIRALEQELGSPLFNRMRGNITLTPAGETLLPLARRILADTETARRQVQELLDLRHGTVRLGATPSLCTGFLPEVLHAFHLDYPGIRLLVEEGGSRDLIRDLAQGHLDLALIILPLHSSDPALSTTPLLREDLVVVTSENSPPPARDGHLQVSDLRHRPLVMFRRGYDLREFTVSACRIAGFEPTFAIEGGEMDAVVGFVEAGLGAAVIPSMVARRQRLRTTAFAPPGLHRTIGLAHRRDVEPPRAAQELRRSLRAYLKSTAEAGTLPPGTDLLPG
ncbi:LysR substrate-binding domain-containing protein [Frankia sp. Mgl5]|uniref:LysR family transcriptional regulator n=1 Tax=Frankiaceae TaxID=74712 RepID=UPI000DA583C7|nr:MULTISPECIES: LysR substrate-binding domain-containing protein [Frankiaceae]MCK9929667.1 LysR substrate-binding domain-containing protein [Frankia sp. Mgl5]TCJ33207.1 LysR family transcriptional regulator [Parafrankia sp. BMG5.11]CAI7974560.1 LysR family transcriptional regulator, cyn operon transcriptional activator [Frankia sp. Hr75.2]SQD93608.1 Transcriptional regulator, LysR family [Parafrankia sp. Ea1.12]